MTGTTAFPGGIDDDSNNLNTVGDLDLLKGDAGGKKIHSKLHNNTSAAIGKIQSVLGTGWAAGDTVLKRLNALAKEVEDLTGHGAVGSGGNPAVRSSEMTGTVIAFAGDLSNAPVGWIACDGKSYPQIDTKYKALFAAIGTRHNTSATPAGQFSVPNMGGRVPVGHVVGQIDNGAGVAATALAYNEFNPVGKRYGAPYHQLKEEELPIHRHVVPSHTHGGGQTESSRISGGQMTNKPGTGSNWQAVAKGEQTGSANGWNGSDHRHGILPAPAVNTETAGRNWAHSILQPYIVLNYLIHL